MIINNNIPALNTYRQLGVNQANSNKAMEKLSSGLRINRAGDDAAGLAISEKMRAQIRGLDQATRNSQDSISMIQTAEGAMNEVHSILQRMRELATQAANDTNVSVDRDEIQKEINQLTSEINRIGNTTEFNTQRLLNGDKANTFEVTGTSFSGGATSATLQGLTASLEIGANALSSGSYQVEVTKVSGTSGVVTTDAENIGATLTPVTAEVSYAGGATKPSFTSDTINVASGAGNWIEVGGFTSGANMSLELASGASGAFVTVTLTNSGFSSSDKVFVDASGNVSYDNHGVSFELNISGWNSGAGNSVDFASGQATFTGNIGTDQNLWTSVSWDTTGGTTAPTFSGGGIVTTSGVEEGDWTIEVTMNADGSAIDNIRVRMSGGASGYVVDDTVSGGVGLYEAHGISFNLTNANDLQSGATHTLEFTTTQEVQTTVYRDTYSVHLEDASGNTIGSSTTIGTTDWASGAAPTALSGFSGTIGSGGVSLTLASGSSVTVGTSAAFTVDPTTSGEDNSMSFQIGANQNQSLTMDIDDIRSDAINIASDGAATQWVEISRPHEALLDAGTMKSGGESGVGGEAGKFYIEVNYTDSNVVNDGTNSTSVERALDMSSHTNAAASLTVINDAIERVSSERSKLGAVQNRLEYTIANLGTAAENLQAAESRVRDVDMAREMMEFTKNNILSQASQAMLAQANQAPQSVLQLLR